MSGGATHRLRRAVWCRRRATAAGLALTAAALAATGLGGGGTDSGAAHGAGTAAGSVVGSPPERARRPPPLASAPIRIADAGTVRLLRPGDLVDVIAAERTGTRARVLAKGVRVARVPRPQDEGLAQGGALIVLSVPRNTATSLAGAGMSTSLAVILC
ncbi:hypothetical protein [Streptomyces sp. NPDC056061]|uniref:hypothetical protein n=1 Tax=Streptomyces sp. NPDC056061 TaxID=3345700 RepID=UPI0035DE47CE